MKQKLLDVIGKIFSLDNIVIMLAFCLAFMLTFLISMSTIGVLMLLNIL